MGKWLEKTKNTLNAIPTKPTKPSFVSDPPSENEKNYKGIVSFVSTPYRGNQKFIDVLARHSLTMPAIEKGLSLWQQPFDERDLQDIESGVITLEQVEGYLQLWQVQNPEMYQALRDHKVVPIKQTVTPADPLDGLPMLREDRLFIEVRLHRLPSSLANRVKVEYRNVWIDAALQAPNDICRDNTGRRAANTWLRKFVDDHSLPDQEGQI